MLPQRRVKVRLKESTRVDLPKFRSFVKTKYLCALAGKVCKSTGHPHVCEGPLDPHHTPTKGAGGDDRSIVPLCRKAHTLLDVPNWSEKRVEAEYGVEFRPMAAELFALWLKTTEPGRKWARNG